MRRRLLACAAATAVIANAASPAFASGNDNNTASPIKHVIVIIGENRSFDHVFATYKPVNRQDKVLNLLSEGIVKADGTPGANYGKALQYSASDYDVYQIAPTKAPYATLPPALVGGTSTPYVCEFLGVTTGTSCNDYRPAQLSPALAAQPTVENGLEPDVSPYLLTGGTGQTNKTPDQRVHYDGQTATTLPPGPYQLTNTSDPVPLSLRRLCGEPGASLHADAAAARLRRAQGQEGRDVRLLKRTSIAWVEVTIGAGSNGAAQPAGFTDETTGEGSTALGFYNVQQRRRALLQVARRHLFDERQLPSVGQGRHGRQSHHARHGATRSASPTAPARPRLRRTIRSTRTAPGTPVPGYTSALSEIENPEPAAGHQQLLHPGRLRRRQRLADGGLAQRQLRRRLLRQLLRRSAAGRRPSSSTICSSCPTRSSRTARPTTTISSTTTTPAISATARNAYTDTNPNNYVYTIPPSTVQTIGDLLIANKVSWAYYGDQFDEYLERQV